jgi:hypothetical protein
VSNSATSTTVHNINAAISALVNAVELTRDEWRTNPELVDKILPLTIDKIIELQAHLAQYKNLNIE